MNRFKTYLETKKLSKLLLEQAKVDLIKGNDKRAIKHTVEALDNFITALNCFSSLFFEPKKKYR